MASGVALVVCLGLGAICGAVIGAAIALDVLVRHARLPQQYIVVAVDPDGIETLRKPMASTSEVARN
jgi:hypothetical protein